jgi:hypothetical protein
MGELARVDLDLLPREPAYRPIERQAWYSRSVPAAVGIGAGIGFLSTYLSPLVLWVGLAAALVWSVRRRRRMYGLLRDNEDGVALLLSGELDEAAPVFDRLCRRGRLMPALHSLFVHNRAIAHLEAGEHDRAAALLSATLHAGWIGSRGALAGYYPMLLGRLAVTEALRERFEIAEAWRDRAHAVMSTPKRGALLFVDVVVEGRHEAWDRVVELVDDGWSRAENLLTARQQRVVRVIHALALEQIRGADYRAESRDQDLRRALEAVREGRARDIDWLAPGWPTMQAFLARHGLVPAA